MDEQNPQHDFARLDPELIIDSVESLGLHSDARIFALNSYENRVYQIGLDSSLEQPGLSDQGLAQSASRLIGKYYRPHRWSDAQILEEHEFTEALAQQEIPVVAPLRFNQHTLQHYQAFASHSIHSAAAELPSWIIRNTCNRSAVSWGGFTWPPGNSNSRTDHQSALKTMPWPAQIIYSASSLFPTTWSMPTAA